MKLSFEIPSTFDAAREAQQRIMDLVTRLDYDPDSVFAIRLALEEGITNAIKHGNAQDSSKKVRIAAQVNSERIDVTIEDEGSGFAKRKVPDPTAVDNLGRPNGRGILLIESYMSRAKWDRGGRRLRMIRENSPLNIHRNKPGAGIN